jgi:flagellin-like protein
MANFMKNEEGVSAVIGVILMVAITVILAAVIAAFVFQLGGNMPKNKTVGLDVARVNSTHIYVKVMSGADVGNLFVGSGQNGAFNVTVNGGIVPISPTGPIANNTVGSLQYFTPVPQNSQVSVIGWFNDGTQQVIWTGTV